MSQTRDLPIHLPNGEVHLWYGDPAELAADAAIADCRRLLSPAELTSCARFAQDRSRLLYLSAHALLRRVLSHYAALVPTQWQFSVGPYGKPALAGPLEDQLLQFNISHTNGMVACAISRDCEVGVDVESVERVVELTGLARRFFSAAEADELASFPAAGRQQRFYQYWTLKEAYIKAQGAGMSIPLESFTMLLSTEDAIQNPTTPHQPLSAATIRFASPLPEKITDRMRHLADPSQWQFAQFLPNNSHILALAIQRGERPEQRIVVRRATQEFLTTGIWNE